MFKYIKSNSFIAFVFSFPILILGIYEIILNGELGTRCVQTILAFVLVLITENLEKIVVHKILKGFLFFVQFVILSLLFMQFYIVLLLFLFSSQNSKLILFLFGQV